MPPQILADTARLFGRHDQVVADDVGDDAEPFEAHQDRAQVFDTGILDGQLGTGDGGEPEQRRHFDMIRPDAEAGAAQLATAFDVHGVGADAIDLGAERHQEVGEILHVRFGGGVAQHRCAVRDDGGTQRVLGGRDAGFIEEHVGADQLVRLELVVAVGGNGRAELLQGKEMRVDSAAADDIATGRRQHHMAGTRQQRAGEQDGGADLGAKVGVEIYGAHGFRRDGQLVVFGPGGFRANGSDEIDEGLGVADARYIVENDGVRSQQGRGNDRQRRVLVAAGLDRAGQPAPALDDVADTLAWICC